MSSAPPRKKDPAGWQSTGTVAKSSPVVPFRAKDDGPITQALARTVDGIKQLVVIDAPSYEQAGEDLKALKLLERQVHEQYDDDAATANRLHKSITGKRTAALTLLEEASTWLLDQRRAWKEAQEARERDAAREAQREAQEARQQELQEEAAALEREGLHELAAATLDAALTAPAPPVSLPSAVPQTAGIFDVRSFDYEVLNEGLVPREYLTVDHKKVRGVVTALKGATRIPGIRVFEVKTERVRL